MNIRINRTFRMVMYFITFILAYILSVLLNKQEYITMYFIGLIGFMNVELMTYLTTTKYAKVINKLYNMCYIDCDHPICKYLTKYRGKDYFLTFGNSTQSKKIKTCLISLWGVLHFLLFAIIGIYVKGVLVQVVLVSLIYEYLEYVLYNCHDVFDIVLNVAGYLFGSYVISVHR